MKNYIKIVNHLLRLHSDKSFFTLGYPRSGTTMLSELVSMLSYYNFDRQNIFYNSAPRVMHTHWVRELDHQRSIYIIRNPKEVSLSVRRFSDVRGLNIKTGDELRSKKICSVPWMDHIEFFRDKGFLVVDYTSLLKGDVYTVNLIAQHLSVPDSFVEECLRVLNSRHLYIRNPVDEELAKEKLKTSQLIEESFLSRETSFYETFLDEYKNK